MDAPRNAKKRELSRSEGHLPPESKPAVPNPPPPPRVTETDPRKFSGIAYALVYNPHPQGFADYAVATLVLKEGVLESAKFMEVDEMGENRSVYLGAEEAIDRLTALNSRLLEKLRVNYPAGYRHV